MPRLGKKSVIDLVDSDTEDVVLVSTRPSKKADDQQPGTSGYSKKPELAAATSKVIDGDPGSSVADDSVASANAKVKGKQPRKRNNNQATTESGPMKKQKPTLVVQPESQPSSKLPPKSVPKPVILKPAPKPGPQPAKSQPKPKPVTQRPSEFWDPASVRASCMPDSLALKRIKHDIACFQKEPPEGIFVYPLEADQSVVHALIVGPPDTPYDGGFFHFMVKFTQEYPMEPPKVKLLTTNGGKVRFNPNLYANGKVCLSILGTWQGPRWTPCNSLLSVLLSIQSLLNENPYANEPGYDKVKPNSKEAIAYNRSIRCATLHVAIIGNLESALRNVSSSQPIPGSHSLPKELCAKMCELFPKYFPRYVAACDKVKAGIGQKLTFSMNHAFVFDSSFHGAKFDPAKAKEGLDAILAQLGL